MKEKMLLISSPSFNFDKSVGRGANLYSIYKFTGLLKQKKWSVIFWKYE